MTLTEASRPDIKNVATRKKLANNLNQARKNIVNTKDTKTKEKLKNIAKYDATTYGAGKQNENNSSVVSKKNNEQMNLNSKRPDLDLLSKKNFIRMNEGETMTFESRLLQEDAYNPGGGFDNHMKKNWGKYATGAGLGALATGAAHVMGGTDMLDDAKELYQNDELGNTVIDKVQGGLDYLKNDNNHANFASGHNSNDYSDGSSDFKNGSVFKPKFDKLQDVVSSGDSASSGPMAPPAAAADNKVISGLQDQLKASQNEATLQKSLNNAPEVGPQDPSAVNPALFNQDNKGWFAPDNKWGEDDLKHPIQTQRADITDPQAEAFKNEQINKAYDAWSKTQATGADTHEAANDKLREIMTAANKDNNISPEELRDIQIQTGKVSGSKPDALFDMKDASELASKDLGVTTSPDKLLSNNASLKTAMANQTNAEFKNGLDYVKQNPQFQFLLNKDPKESLTFLQDLKIKGVLPPELEPVFQKLQNYQPQPEKSWFSF